MHLLLVVLVYKPYSIYISLAKSKGATFWFPGLNLLLRTVQRFCFKFEGREFHTLCPRIEIFLDPWYADRIAGVLKSLYDLWWVCDVIIWCHHLWCHHCDAIMMSLCLLQKYAATISGSRWLLTLNISIAMFWMFLWWIEAEPIFSNNSS